MFLFFQKYFFFSDNVESEQSKEAMLKEMGERYNATAANFTASTASAAGHKLEKRSAEAAAGKELNISLSDHEAITSSVILFKYRWN